MHIAATIFGVGLSAMAFWFLVLRGGGSRKRLEVVRQFATSLGLKEQEVSGGTLFSASGDFKDRHFKLLVDFVLLGNIAASHQRRLETVLQGGPVSVKSSLLVARPWIDLPGFVHQVPPETMKCPIGHESFDRVFQVFAAEGSVAKSQLNEERIRALMGISSLRELRIADGTATISLSMLPPREELDAALHLLESFR